MPKRNLIWIVAIIAATVVTAWVTRHNPPPLGESNQTEFRSVGRTYRLIKDRYYRQPEEDRIRQGAVKGMVDALDEFSTYVPPGDVVAFKRRIMGIERGLGLRVKIAGGQVLLVGWLAGSPAGRAGFAAGDRIMSIDGRSVAGLSLEGVRKLLDGKVGSRAVLEILRAGKKAKSITLTRQEFPVETVTGLYRDRTGKWVYLIDEADGLAYLRIKEFVRKTPEQFQQAFRQLGQVNGLIVDLRGNPGGLLPGAVEVADMFLHDGLIVTVFGRDSKPQRHLARADRTYPDIPMVVLLNAKTASAAEIVAGALRVGRRAVLVGTRTRGKGCVQSMFPLPDELGQINLTTSEFTFGPSGSITRRGEADAWGIDPHEQITLPPAQQRRLVQLRGLVELIAPRRPTTRPAAETAPASQSPIVREMLELDLQLARAIELLKTPEKIEALLEEAPRQTRAAATTKKLRAGRKLGHVRN